MPHRKLAGDILSYASSGAITGGGLVAAVSGGLQTEQGYYGLIISIIGFFTLALPHIAKELQARRDERKEEKGYARKLAAAESKLAAAQAQLQDMRTHQVEPNTVSIAALDGQFRAFRDDLVRAGVIKPSPSTDTMPVVRPALLVEDDPDTARPMGEVLGSAFYQVQVAATLAAALEALGKHPYDLVLLDLGLPDGDGTEVLRAARRNRLACRFVVTTGFSDDARLDRVRSYLTERDRLLIKPVHFHDLMAAVLPPRSGEPR